MECCCSSSSLSTLFLRSGDNARCSKLNTTTFKQRQQIPHHLPSLRAVKNPGASRSRPGAYYMMDVLAFDQEDNQNQTRGEICFSDSKNMNEEKPEAISLEELDEWMNKSVSEIVKNIGEAPFLMHVYSKKNNTLEEELELEKEKAAAENWQSITSRWQGQPSAIPDGIILVEQLKDHNDDYDLIEEEEEEEEEDTMIHPNNVNSPSSSSSLSTTKAWGVLVQGRGVDRSACYILKTCRVSSSCGFCTHFSLMRAKCFGESAQLQLNNSWRIMSN